MPINVDLDIDERVMSIWVQGDETLLQLSSHIRSDGEQVGASQRLSARLSNGTVHNTSDMTLHISGCGDVAAAAGQDEQGIHWTYAYAVWPDLMIFASISHPQALPTSTSWAIDAICSIRRILQ